MPVVDWRVPAAARAADAVAAYLLNLNRNRAYQKLRLQRQMLRTAGKEVRAADLLPFLGPYTRQNPHYVATIAQIVAHYHLEA